MDGRFCEYFPNQYFNCTYKFGQSFSGIKLVFPLFHGRKILRILSKSIFQLHLQVWSKFLWNQTRFPSIPWTEDSANTFQINISIALTSLVKVSLDSNSFSLYSMDGRFCEYFPNQYFNCTYKFGQSFSG